jgi:hypothetical protein
MDATANLNLPFIVAAQAQKHVTHNEALRALDAIVQLMVLDKDLGAPPGAPAEGDRYIVAAGATGAWATHDGRIAAWQDGAWSFYTPQEGWLVWIADEDKLYAWTSTAWAPLPVGQLAVSSVTFPPLRVERVTGVTSTIPGAQQLMATTSGDMVDGFGVNLNFAIRDDANAINEIGSLAFVRSGADNSGRFQIQPYNAGVIATRFEIAPGGNVYFPGIGTTASAANAVLNVGSSPANELLRSTSSLRYKIDIRDLATDWKRTVRGLRPITYRSKAPADDPALRWLGLIAEEVSKVEPCLVNYATDPDGKKVPESVQYERLTVLLLKAVQELLRFYDAEENRGSNDAMTQTD